MPSPSDPMVPGRVYTTGPSVRFGGTEYPMPSVPPDVETAGHKCLDPDDLCDDCLLEYIIDGPSKPDDVPKGYDPIWVEAKMQAIDTLTERIAQRILDEMRPKNALRPFLAFEHPTNDPEEGDSEATE